MTFSWAHAKEKALKHMIRRAITEAKQHPQAILDHPDEVKDAKTNNYVAIKARVTKQVLKEQKLALDRRNKSIGK